MIGVGKNFSGATFATIATLATSAEGGAEVRNLALRNGSRRKPHGVLPGISSRQSDGPVGHP